MSVEHEVKFQNPNDEIQRLGTGPDQAQVDVPNRLSTAFSVAHGRVLGADPKAGLAVQPEPTGPKTANCIWDDLNRTNAERPMMDGVTACKHNLDTTGASMQTGASYVMGKACQQVTELASGIMSLFKSPTPEPEVDPTMNAQLALQSRIPQWQPQPGGLG